MTANWPGQPYDPNTPPASASTPPPAQSYGPPQQPTPYGQQPSPYSSLQPTYGQPPVYSAQQPAYMAPVKPVRMIDGSREKNGFNGWALALSIIGICCLPTALAGAIMGFFGRQYAQEDRATNEGVATAALIVGSVLTVLHVIYWIGRYIMVGSLFGTSIIDSGYGL